MSINNSINNSSLSNNNNTSFASETMSKKVRKDAKGNLILKKEKRKLKSKFHVHLIDNVCPGKQFAQVIDIESYKKYNLDDDDDDEIEGIDPPNKNEVIQEDKTEIKQRCCCIF